jgi:L-asparaginase II
MGKAGAPATGATDAGAAPVLVEVGRGPLVESIHRGCLAVVDSGGALLYRVGDPDKVTFFRSSSKPIQALTIILSGAADRFALTEKELAVTAASHNAEDFHVEAALSILSKAGLAEDALQCGAHLPLHGESARRLVREGRRPTAVHSNCSGKHSGMLAACRAMGWPVEGYLSPAHPLQRWNLELVARVCDATDISIGIDGCGVPVFGLPVRNMAYGFARLADPDTLPSDLQAPARRVVAAMRAHPEMVAGTGRFCTDLMRAAGDRLVAKSGAEAVYCAGFLKGETAVAALAGVGVAVKIEDGGSRATAPAMMKAMMDLGVLDVRAVAALGKYARPESRNERGDLCGEIRAVFTLEAGAAPAQASAPMRPTETPAPAGTPVPAPPARPAPGRRPTGGAAPRPGGARRPTGGGKPGRVR